MKWIKKGVEAESSGEDVEPVEEDNRERLNKMGPAPESGVYHKPRKEDFTEYRRHGSQRS